MDRLHVVAAHFNLLPYHAARYNAYLRKTGGRVRLTSLLLRATEEYKLFQQKQREGDLFDVIRFSKTNGLNAKERVARIVERLYDLDPDIVVLVGGYGEPEGRVTMWFAAREEIPLVLCSESQEKDFKRVWWQEKIKARIYGNASSFLVGGQPQREYCHKLGVKSEKVFIGNNVVDNRFFDKQSKIHTHTNALGAGRHIGARRERTPSFLTNSRFVEKKNLLRLIDAYAQYHQRAVSQRFSQQKHPNLDPWHLTLVGDGPMMPAVQERIRQYELDGFVHLPGFVQYEELPKYYAACDVFILASTSEQWGLVVNEAMASGLPVIVSERCGCVRDLVQYGVNGFTFDPENVSMLSDLMFLMADGDLDLDSMAAASKQIVQRWGPDAFAEGLTGAIDTAIRDPKNTQEKSFFDTALLWLLART